MKRSQSRFLPVVLALTMAVSIVLAVSACDEEGDTQSETLPTERIRISGSGTCLPLIRILTEKYHSDHPDVEFVFLPGLHSGGGIRGVANGDLEIGSVSRELNDDEKELGLEYYKLSDDGLVIATHPSVDIDGLTSEQVRGVYEGKYESWEELGGPDMMIVILDRNEDESAKIILREYVLGPDLVVSDRAVNLFYEPDMVDGLKKSPGAIGYFSLGFGLSDDVPVNYLKLDGVEASVGNIEDDSYKAIRPLGVVISSSASSEIKDFVEWTQTDEARSLMRQSGFAPALPDTGD